MKKKKMKLRNEPQVHVDFPNNAFKTKEAWLKDVRKNWIAFRRAFKESGIKSGNFYYPLAVSCWMSAFDCDERNMDKLMTDYYNGKSEEKTGTCVFPISIYKEFTKK